MTTKTDQSKNVAVRRAKNSKLPVPSKGGTDVVIYKTPSGGIDVDATAPPTP